MSTYISCLGYQLLQTLSKPNITSMNYTVKQTSLLLPVGFSSTKKQDSGESIYILYPKHNLQFEDVGYHGDVPL